jgi:hypothetical protein
MKRADLEIHNGGDTEMNKLLKNNGAKILTDFSPDQTKNLSPLERVERLEETAEDLRLKKLLRRAVGKDFAPQSLIDSIRNGIRR